MSDGFFVLTSGEDGTRVEGPLDQRTLLERITPDDEGDSYYGSGVVFLGKVPDNDNGCWIGVGRAVHAVLIIRGVVIQPKPTQSYEL